MDIRLKKFTDKCNDVKITPTQHFIFVEIAKQLLGHFKDGILIKDYAISTSRNPPSCIKDSLGTPTGLHKIDGKIGAGETLDTVFRARKPDGKLSEQSAEEQQKNLILARIMRLRGLEDGINSGGNLDTYERFVYIHGTNQEDKIGTPNSHGCILMRNAEIADLFDIVPDGTLVFIEGL